MSCWKPHLIALFLLYATACSSSDVSCSDRCIDQQRIAEASPGWDDEASHVARCEVLDDGSCADCERQIGEMFSREYSAIGDCYCIVAADERDPQVESVYGENGCDSLIDRAYEGDPVLLEESCTCE